MSFIVFQHEHNSSLPNEERLTDGLAKIKLLRKEVWAVKLADLITNLQSPPKNWSRRNIRKYQDDSRLILNEPRGGHEFMEKRQERKIKECGRQ